MKHLLQEDQRHDALDDAKGLSRLLTHLAEEEDVDDVSDLFTDTKGDIFMKLSFNVCVNRIQDDGGENLGNYLKDATPPE